MSKYATYYNHISRLALIIATILATISTSVGQTNTAGNTPLTVTPGAPSGSYTLSDFDNINLFNGNLNFRLPLLTAHGRGGAQHTIALPIEQRWGVGFHHDAGEGFYYPSYNMWYEVRPGYGPGVLLSRQSETGDQECWSTYNHVAQYELTRLTFVTPDGTEYELLDKKTGGKPLPITDACLVTVESRGSVWTTPDGQSLTFIADDENDLSNGFLLFRDGSRYRVDNHVVTWTRDRNGNQIKFTYDQSRRVKTITDSLNRVINIDYDVTDPLPYGLCDRIRYRGFDNVERIIRVSKGELLSVRLRPGSGYVIKTPAQLFNGYFASYPHNDVPFNGAVTSAVWLPDGRSYQFYYNEYAELARVELPIGGAFEYDWLAGVTDGPTGGVWAPSDIYRRVVERRVYADGGTGATFNYKATYSRPESQAGTLGYVLVQHFKAGGTILSKDKHYFHGSAAFSTANMSWPLPNIILSPWNAGKEYKTELQNSAGTVLRRVEHTWQQRSAVSWWNWWMQVTSQTSNPPIEPANDPRLVTTLTTIEPGGANLVTKRTAINPQTGAVGFDEYNNQTDVYEYNFGSGAPGTLVRRTHTDYLTTNSVNGADYDTVNPDITNPNPATTIHLRGLPTQTSVYDVAGVEKARTTYEYDKHTIDANHAGLVSRSNISNLDSSFTTAYTTRGNVTAITRYIFGSPTTTVSEYAQFDIAGNAVKTIDGRGYATISNFADRFGAPDLDARLNIAPLELSSVAKVSYAFPTLITNALNHTVYIQRDYYTGKIVNTEDANAVTSAVEYNDALGRPTKLIRAVDDNSVHSQTSVIYDDANGIVRTTSDLDDFEDTAPLMSETVYDGLGRSIEQRQYETPTSYVCTKRTYDALGRVDKVSNPYRTGTVLWTTTTFDALGRVTSVKTPDNAIVSTTYSGNTVTVNDQANHDRQSTTDALGRLTQVVEDPGGLAYVTTNSYDVLGNLITVTQGVQTRTFTYDSLSRLKSSTYPESGSVNYTYDQNGNLLTRIDGRSIQTTFTYDALNRVTLKNYSDTTPDVAYFYDAQTLPAGAPSFVRGSSTGRLVAVTTGGTNAGTYRGYDAMGQIVRQYQRTDSVNYLVEATYNKASATVTETYPSVAGAVDRRTVSHNFDLAGRLAALGTLATTYAPASSVTSVSYAPHGALASETLGNGLIHAQIYNNRLQPTQIKLGTAAVPTSVMNLTYNYGTTTNNGNLLSTTYAGGGLSYTQTFGYDQLNRLTTSQEGASWSQTNSYDRYGNRSIVGNPLSFSGSNNRITTPGYTYDAVGNVTNDGAQTFAYDAENKITKVNNVPAYVYDGEGQRVRKLVGENLRFVYDIRGNLIAEFDGTSGALKKEYIYGAGGLAATIEPTAVNSNGTRYTTSDHLGSPRVVTSSTATVVSRHDFKPFGEEIGDGVGGRTTGMGYSAADGLRPKFTSKERDAETGLDYFLARYYSAVQGRFSSPDTFGGRAVSPQTLNLYSYALNNPLRFVDPTGHVTQDPDIDHNRAHPNKPCNEQSPCDPDANDVLVTHTNQDKHKPVRGSGILDLPSPLAFPMVFCPTGMCNGRTIGDDVNRIKQLHRATQALNNAVMQNTDSVDVNASVFWVIQGEANLTADGDIFVSFTPPQTSLIEVFITGARQAVVNPVPFSLSVTGTHIFYGDAPADVRTRRSFYGGESLSLGGAIPIARGFGPYVGGVYSPSTNIYAVRGGFGTAPQIGGGYSLAPTEPITTYTGIRWKY